MKGKESKGQDDPLRFQS